REMSKHEGITNILYDAITSRHVIHPSFGSAEFFEFSFKNPYNQEQNIIIKCDDPDLRILTSSREWRHYKKLHEVHTPLEENMFNQDSQGQHPEIFMKPSEVVNIPFKFQSFRADHLARDQVKLSIVVEFKQQLGKITCIQPRTIKVSFVTKSNENPVAILALHVEPQPHIIDQTFRFYHPENSFFKRSIRLPPWRSNTGGSFMTDVDDQKQLYVKCSDPNVVCDSKPTFPGEPQDIFLKVACSQSPSVKRFYLLLFSDNYLSRPIQTWQFFIHAQQRVDICATEGQTLKQSLILRGTPVSRLIQCYSSHPAELMIAPTNEFMLMANSVHELIVTVIPKSSGQRIMYINVVDTEYHQLVHSWLVCVAVKLPIISKAFEINIVAGKSSNKRISFTNPYPMRKRFRLKCNREDLLQFREGLIEVEGGGSHMIGLKFLPSDDRNIVEIFIFINDEDDKNEETFCVKVKYM
ncbi:uncharacterized protein TRIADDRAFT_26181, partial [Trichoplax adhaerens]